MSYKWWMRRSVIGCMMREQQRLHPRVGSRPAFGWQHTTAVEVDMSRHSCGRLYCQLAKGERVLARSLPDAIASPQ